MLEGARQVEAANRVGARRLSVRETEAWCGSWHEHPRRAKGRARIAT
jgi:hypothetical protein